MGNYHIQAKKDFDVNYEGSVIKLKAGDKWPPDGPTEDACKMLKFISGIPGPVSEEGATVEELKKKCTEQQGSAAPTFNYHPDPGTEGVGNQNVPFDGDSPESLEAPKVNTNAEVIENRNLSDLQTDSRDPNEILHDTKNPVSNGELYDNQRFQGLTHDEALEGLARAHRGEPRIGNPRTTHSNEKTNIPAKGGDPVDLYSGLFVLTMVDLEVPNPFIPIQLVRRYQSGRPYFGPWGFNWDHNWNVYLRELNNGDVVRWNGQLHEDLFHWNNNKFEPPRGIFEKLIRDSAHGLRYRIIKRGGIKLIFERPPGWTDIEKIPLISIVDRAGNKISLNYDEYNRLKSVIDDDGRGLFFNYGHCGFLELIEDNAGRCVKYQHDQSREHLVRVILPPTTDFPEGVQTCYEYMINPPHIALLHNIIRVVDNDNNTILENKYGIDPIQTSFNRVIHQNQGEFVFKFDYKKLQYIPKEPQFINYPYIQTSVCYPDCTLHVYTFNYRSDLIDERFRLSRDKSFRVVISKYEYDNQGNLITRIKPSLVCEEYTYDNNHNDPRMRGNLLKIETKPSPTVPVMSRVLMEADYDTNFQQVTRITNEDGATTRYKYDFDLSPSSNNQGNLMEIRWPDCTLPDGTIQQSKTSFEYNNKGQMTAVITSKGIRHEFEYITLNSFKKSFLHLIRKDTNLLSIEEIFEYDEFGFPFSIQDGTGTIRKTIYNKLGQIEKRISPPINGSTVELITHYNMDGKINSIERPRGSYMDCVISSSTIIDSFERDILGNITRMNFGNNTNNPRVISRELNDFRGFPKRVIDPLGSQVNMDYDERGLLLKQVKNGFDQTKHTTRFIYDTEGKIERLIEGNLENKQTHYEYDGFGRLCTVYLINGTIIRYIWGKRDLLIQEEIEGDSGDGTTCMLLKKRYEYDKRSRLIKIYEYILQNDSTSELELEFQYFYDNDNNLIKIVDPRGGNRIFEYDGLGRVVRNTDPEGNIQIYSYDNVNRLISIEYHDQEPNGVVVRTWSFEYDERGREVKIIRPDGTEMERLFDDRDLPIIQIGPLGIEYQRKFGQLGELLIETTDPQGLGIINKWEYNLKNQPIRYIDPTNEVSHYFYDGLGRIIKTEQPGNYSVVRSFNKNGQLQKETLSSGVYLNYNYDKYGRLSSITSNIIADVTPIKPHIFQYDGLDRLISAVTGSSKVTRTYDSRSRLIKETTNGVTLETHYDDIAGTIERCWPDGRCEKISSNLNGMATKLERTSSGLLGKSSSLLGTFNPSGSNHFGSEKLFGGLSLSASYDKCKRLIKFSFRKNDNFIEDLIYYYDARNRRRVSVVCSVPKQIRYNEFDNQDRLILSAEDFSIPIIEPALTQDQHDIQIAAIKHASINANLLLEYKYNKSDARLIYKETGKPDRDYKYSPGQRIISAGLEKFTHYNNGTRKSDGSRKFITDSFGRICQITDLDGRSLLTIHYDALGRPTKFEELNYLPRSLYYFGNELWQENEANTPIKQISLHPVLMGSLAIHVLGESYLTLHDIGLNLTASINSSGQVIERYRYKPFGIPAIFSTNGNLLSNSAIGLTPIFGGMPYFDKIELYAARYRFMDPVHGIFVSPDPYGYINSPFLYGYSVQDPINRIDPSGNIAFLGILVVMAVGALITGGLNAARQGIKIAEGSQKEFSWGEVGLSAGIGAVAAPILVVAPELAIPLAAFGIGAGIREFKNGNIATGTFDIACSIVPFGFKGPRNAIFGLGSRIGQIRGIGQSAGWSARFNRFNEIGGSTTDLINRVYYEKFYHGNTQASVRSAVTDFPKHLELVRFMQRNTPGTRHLGDGLYFTRSPGDRSIPGSARWWADHGGGTGRPGPTSVLEAEIPRWRMFFLRRKPGVLTDVPQESFPEAPQSFFSLEGHPNSPAAHFARYARFSELDLNVPEFNFNTMWPSIFSPPYRSFEYERNIGEPKIFQQTPNITGDPPSGKK